MSQTTATINMAQARPGHIADSSIIQDVVSKLAENSAGLIAGTFVVPGTDAENQAAPPGAAADITVGDGWGVVLYDATAPYPKNAATIAADAEYDDEQAVPILRKGRIWVLCDAGATITANSSPFVRHTAAGAEVLGAFREDADGGDASALPGAFFRTAHQDVNFGAGAQRVALLELNLPVTA